MDDDDHIQTHAWWHFYQNFFEVWPPGFVYNVLYDSSSSQFQHTATCGETERVYKILVGKYLFRRPMLWQDNNKIDHKYSKDVIRIEMFEALSSVLLDGWGGGVIPCCTYW